MWWLVRCDSRVTWLTAGRKRMHESDWLVLSSYPSLAGPFFSISFCLLPSPLPHPTMSEYWVSHKKYLCKYCNIYIADDAPSRVQHESGLRHKGNVERFVRNLYKTGEKRKQDLEEEKREMARVEKVSRVTDHATDILTQNTGCRGRVCPGRRVWVSQGWKCTAASKQRSWTKQAGKEVGCVCRLYDRRIIRIHRS